MSNWAKHNPFLIIQAICFYWASSRKVQHTGETAILCAVLYGPKQYSVQRAYRRADQLGEDSVPRGPALCPLWQVPLRRAANVSQKMLEEKRSTDCTPSIWQVKKPQSILRQRKRPLILYYSTLRYAALLCATLRYSPLLYSTLLYSTLLYSTLLYFTLLYSTLLYSILHQSSLVQSSLLFSSLLCCTLLYSTPLCATYSTLACWSLARTSISFKNYLPETMGRSLNFLLINGCC